MNKLSTTAAGIAVVDDDLSVRAVAAEYLKDEGYGVLESEDDPGMRRILGETDTTIVLPDVVPSRDDSLKLARELRRRPNVGVIKLPAQGSAANGVDGLKMDADDRAMDAQVRRLRCKLVRCLDGKATRTIRGMEYHFPPEVRQP